jgi:hypothetical protein
MASNEKNLEGSWKKRGEDAQGKALMAIRQLQAKGAPVNFASVHKSSGVSKSFLYTNADIRKDIESIRTANANNEQKQLFRYQKTQRSKDIVVEAKDKRIAKLEKENERLKNEIGILRGLLYEAK